MRILVLIIVLLTISSAGFSKSMLSANPSTKEFQHENLSFDYLATDGSFWYECKHEKDIQPHSWIVYCDRYVFKLHILLNVHQRENETTFEFHYWADEFDNLNETHTQSTWLTVDKNAMPNKVIGYLGFAKDATQLRIEIKPE